MLLHRDNAALRSVEPLFHEQAQGVWRVVAEGAALDESVAPVQAYSLGLINPSLEAQEGYPFFSGLPL